VDLKDMMNERFKAWIIQKQPPTTLLFYRDGIRFKSSFHHTECKAIHELKDNTIQRKDDKGQFINEPVECEIITIHESDRSLVSDMYHKSIELYIRSHLSIGTNDPERGLDFECLNKADLTNHTLDPLIAGGKKADSKVPYKLPMRCQLTFQTKKTLLHLECDLVPYSALKKMHGLLCDMFESRNLKDATFTDRYLQLIKKMLHRLMAQRDYMPLKNAMESEEFKRPFKIGWVMFPGQNRTVSTQTNAGTEKKER
jgi:hypothetical protein